MKRILIADASKASLVMTSEVFKDHFPGVQVVVARSSAECLELVKSTENVDAYVIDFDLPDRDGAWTAARLKKHSQTPVLITAFDRPDVHDVIEEELAAYDDCLNWLRKPVKAETVVAVAQRYCEGKYRTQRRLGCAIPALAEVVVTTVMTKTVKETVKVPVPAAPVKAAASKASAVKGKSAAQAKNAKNAKKPTKAMASKLASKAGAKNAKTPEKFTTKIVTRTVTEKVHAKALVPATVTDASLGGVRVELDFSGYQTQGQAKTSTGDVTWSIKAGEILAVHLPSLESLESGNAKAWKDWQKNKVSLQASLTTPVAPSKAAHASQAASAASAAAAMKGTKGRSTLSTLPTLSQKTLKSAVKGTTDGTLILRGRICWTTQGADSQACGLEIENAAQARRLFEIVASHYNALRKAGGVPSTHAQQPAAPTVTASTLSFRNARHNAS